METGKKLRVAFIVRAFPTLSETFIINQIADLLDQGVEVEIFSFRRGDMVEISQRYYDYGLGKRVRYLDEPKGRTLRILAGFAKALSIVIRRPALIKRMFD